MVNLKQSRVELDGSERSFVEGRSEVRCGKEREGESEIKLKPQNGTGR